MLPTKSVEQESIWNPALEIVAEAVPGIGMIKFPGLVLSVFDVVVPEPEVENVKDTVRD